jgi:hypothetical protein
VYDCSGSNHRILVESDTTRVHLRRAQEAYAQALSVIAGAELNPDERSEIDRPGGNSASSGDVADH